LLKSIDHSADKYVGTWINSAGFIHDVLKNDEIVSYSNEFNCAFIVMNGNQEEAEGWIIRNLKQKTNTDVLVNRCENLTFYFSDSSRLEGKLYNQLFTIQGQKDRLLIDGVLTLPDETKQKGDFCFKENELPMLVAAEEKYHPLIVVDENSCPYIKTSPSNDW